MSISVIACKVGCPQSRVPAREVENLLGGFKKTCLNRRQTPKRKKTKTPVKPDAGWMELPNKAC